MTRRRTGSPPILERADDVTVRRLLLAATEPEDVQSAGWRPGGLLPVGIASKLTDLMAVACGARARHRGYTSGLETV